MSKFTDRQLVQLYSGICEDYKNYKAQGLERDEIRDILRLKVENTLNPYPMYGVLEPSTEFAALDYIEKDKVRSAFNTIMSALETQQTSQASASSTGSASGQPYQSARHYGCTHQCCAGYYSDRPRLYTWVYIGSYDRPYAARSASRFDYNPSYSQSRARQSQAELAFVLIAMAAIFAAALSAYYLFHEMANSFERFYYNEGWVQSAMSYLSMAASAMVSSILSMFYAATPLYKLSLAAGFANPAVATAVVLIALTVIGSALGCMAFNAVQDYMVKNSSQDALDPEDPARFALTEEDVKAWPSSRQETIDPIKVKCAIVALRAQLGEKCSFSTMSKLFSSSDVNQQRRMILEKVRQLRAGKLDTLKVGELTFDFRFNSEPSLLSQDSQSSNTVFAEPGTPRIYAHAVPVDVSYEWWQ